MANKLPPLPAGVAPGSGFWNDWYEKLRVLINSTLSGISWTIIQDRPTTLAGYGITDAAELNGSNRVIQGTDTTDDLIIDDETNGLVLKSASGHYWRVTMTNAGSFTITDLGVTKP